MKEMYDPIPKRCQSCPIIFPTLSKYLQVEAELYFAEASRHQLTEYADPENIAARIGDLRSAVDELRDELETLRGRTIGCYGVKISQVRLGEDHIDHVECQSER